MTDTYKGFTDTYLMSYLLRKLPIQQCGLLNRRW